MIRTRSIHNLFQKLQMAKLSTPLELSKYNKITMISASRVYVKKKVPFSENKKNPEIS